MTGMLIDNHGRAIQETCLTADQVAWMDGHPSSAPKSPLEAAIDKATGYEPGDENRVVSDAAQDGHGEDGGAEGEPTTASVQQQVDAAPVEERHDWVEEAYKCFIENAVDLEPTDPVKAIGAYFEKNAADNLKMKVEHEGKTAEGCWKFIEAVAKKALGSRSGHIDPVAVYAIAMHYFQDVPKDWDKVEKAKPKTKAKTAKLKTKKIEELERKISQPGSAKHAQELKAKLKAEKERVREKEKKQKAKKRGGEQGFFFDLMETETVGPDEGNGVVAAAEQDGKEAGDAE